MYTFRFYKDSLIEILKYMIPILFYVGNEVVIVKNGLRICGNGGALTNAPLVQSKSYFEVKIQQSGIWAVGLARRDTDLNVAEGGKDSESWALNWDGIVRHNQQELHKIQNPAQEGDVIVCIIAFFFNFNKLFSKLIY